MLVMDCPGSNPCCDQEAEKVSSSVLQTETGTSAKPTAIHTQAGTDCGSQTSEAGWGVDSQRGRSPPPSSGGSDSYKLKPCASTQCGGNSNYEFGSCQQPMQNRVYPQYIQQQQQMNISMRSMHQPQHHYPQCHPQHSMTHMDRMIHGGSSVAIATTQRSMVVSHYPSNGGGYQQSHQNPGPNYYHQMSSSGPGSYMDYHNPHHHQHHQSSHGLTMAAAYAQQQHQQRVLTSTAVLNTYRQLPIHQPKVMNSNQAYQNAYQQPNYNQYYHHQGIMGPHPHQNMQSTAGVMQQRMVGIPMSNVSQQHYPSRSQVYAQQQQHNHGYSGTSHIPPLIPNLTSSQQHQPLANSLSSSAGLSVNSHVDSNNNNEKNTMGSSSTEILGSKSSKNSLEVQTGKRATSSSSKITLLKHGSSSADKSKLKVVRSVAKLRERPRLLVGQKKKSVGSGNTSRKMKSTKALSTCASTDLTKTSSGLLWHSLSERFDSACPERTADSNESLKCSGGLNDDCDRKSLNTSPLPKEESHESPTERNACDLQGPLNGNCIHGGGDYIYTQDEARKYMSRMNTCSALNIPPFFAFSVFHGKLEKNKSSPFSEREINDCLTEADIVWSNFQDDMAVLELCFPVTSTMEQSDRAEKLDAIYTYEAQLRNVHSNGVRQTPGATVMSGQDPACDCCFSFLHGISSPRMGSPEQFSGTDSMSPRSSGFLREPRYGTDSACQLQPNYVSTPVSSRRTYAGIPSLLSEDCGFYSRQDLPRCRPLVATRKRSSSFPTRKHGRRSSGSKDHLKTETESFLDELINTANEEKHSKKRNSRGEVTAPEIKCELDFPSLPSTNPVPCSNKTSPMAKGNTEEASSDRDNSNSTGSSSSGATEESESNSSSGCSSSPNSTQDTSTDADYDGSNGMSLIDSSETPSFESAREYCSPDQGQGSDHYEDISSGRSSAGQLWEEFRGDQVASVSTHTYGVSQGDILASDSPYVCRQIEALCPTRPPPGFEHLSRPSFPIEIYDPTLLGGLIGGQLPRDVLNSLESSSSVSRKQFAEMEEMLASLTCCEKHASDTTIKKRCVKSVRPEPVEKDDPVEEIDDWEFLDKAIKHELNLWNDEIRVLKQMQNLKINSTILPEPETYGGSSHNAPEAVISQQSIYEALIETTTNLSAIPTSSGGLKEKLVS